MSTGGLVRPEPKDLCIEALCQLTGAVDRSGRSGVGRRGHRPATLVDGARAGGAAHGCGPKLVQAATKRVLIANPGAWCVLVRLGTNRCRRRRHRCREGDRRKNTSEATPEGPVWPVTARRREPPGSAAGESKPHCCQCTATNDCLVPCMLCLHLKHEQQRRFSSLGPVLAKPLFQAGAIDTDNASGSQVGLHRT